MSRFLIAAFAILTSVTGACGEKDGETIAGPKKGVEVFFALKQVHPNNEQLLSRAKSGEPLPPDYSVFPIKEVDYGRGEVVGERSILLKKTNIITAEMVEFASLSGDEENSVLVRLTKKGAARFTHATKQMRLGIDRIAIVFEDRCLIAPTVQSVLVEQFIISGLSGRDEAKRLSHLLMAPIR